MSDGMGREFAYLSSHAPNRYFIPNWGMNYGKRVQNSVFECILTESQFITLRNQLDGIIDSEQDSIRFYMLGKNWKNKVETLGKDMGVDFTGELII